MAGPATTDCMYNHEWFEERLTTVEDRNSSIAVCTDAYLILASAIREQSDSQTPATIVEHVERFLSACMQHAQSAPSTTQVASSAASSTDDIPSRAVHPQLALAAAALRFGGFLMSNEQIVSSIGEPLRETTIEALIHNLQNCAFRDKVTVNLTIWCLSIQKFDDMCIKHAVGVIKAFEVVKATGFDSRSIEHETMKCYLRLLDGAPVAMERTAMSWGIDALRNLVSDAMGVRTIALQVLEQGSSMIERKLQNDGIYLPQLLSEFKIIESLQKNNKPGLENWETMACRSCCIMMNLLGSNLGGKLGDNKHRKDISDIASIFAKLFNDKNPTNVIHALDAWACFVHNLCRGRITDKIINFLLKPLTEKRFEQQYVENKVLQRKRVEVWQLILRKLSYSELRAHFSLVLEPLLRICFDVRIDSEEVNTDGSGRVETNIEDYAIDILAEAVAADQQHVSEISRGLLLCSCTRSAVVSGLMGQLRDINATVTIFATLCSRFLSPNRNKTSRAMDDSFSAIYGKLLDIALTAQTVLASTNICAIQKLLLIFVESAPPAMLTTSGKPIQISDKNMSTPFALDAICSIIFSESFLRKTDDKTITTLFRGMLEGAIAAQDPLTAFQVPLTALGYAYELESEQSSFLPTLQTCWISACCSLSHLIALPFQQTYGGSDFEPDFSTVIDVLVFPFQHVHRISTWKAPDFRTSWNNLLTTFCRESDVVNVNGSHPHLKALNHKLLQLEVIDKLDTKSDSKSTELLDFYTGCVAAIVERIKLPRQDLRQTALFADMLIKQMKVLARVLGIGTNILSATHWKQPPPSFTSLLDVTSSLLSGKTFVVPVSLIEDVFVNPMTIMLREAATISDRSYVRSLIGSVSGLWAGLAKAMSASALRNPDYFDSDSLPQYSVLFEVSLVHPHLAISTTACNLWNKTFGTAVWLDYTDGLGIVISEMKKNDKDRRAIPLQTPGWIDNNDQIEVVPPNQESNPIEHNSAPGISISKASVSLRRSGRKPRKSTFLRGHVSFGIPKNKRKVLSDTELKKTQPKTKKVKVDYVDIPASPSKKRVLTEHQKEAKAEQRVRRRELPLPLESASQMEGAETMDCSEEIVPDESKILPSTTNPSSAPVGPVVTPTSILKRKGAAGTDSKVLRVTFDLTANTNYVVERGTPIPDTRKPEFLLRRKRVGKGSTRNSKGALEVLASPPPAGLSPILSKSSRSVLLSMEPTSRSPKRFRSSRMAGPVQSTDKAAEDGPFNDDTPRAGVQRNLEPSFISKQSADTEAIIEQGLPQRGAKVFAGLSDCMEPVAQVLSFFQTNQRRGVNQLLAAKKVNTVGDICSLSREEFATLPFRMTKSTSEDLDSYMRLLAAQRATAPSPLSQIGRRNLTPADPAFSPPLKPADDHIPKKHQCDLNTSMSPSDQNNPYVDALKAIASDPNKAIQSLSRDEITGIQKNLAKIMSAASTMLEPKKIDD